MTKVKICTYLCQRSHNTHRHRSDLKHRTAQSLTSIHASNSIVARPGARKLFSQGHWETLRLARRTTLQRTLRLPLQREGMWTW